jgi:hypothetical protein
MTAPSTFAGSQPASLTQVTQMTDRPTRASNLATSSADDVGLDAVDPSTHTARDAQHFRRIVAARQGLEEAEAELRAAVAAAREAGDSWAVIGAALDTSRQNAYQRFGR